MRYVTQLEVPWPPKDAIAVIGDGAGYTIYQAGDSVPAIADPVGTTDADSINDADLLASLKNTGVTISVEKLGLSTTNSPDLNASRLEQFTLYDPPAPTVLLFPSGKSIPLSVANVRGKGISLQVDGEIAQSGPIILGCGKSAYQAATSNCYRSQKLYGAGRLRASSPNALIPAVQLQYAGDIDITGMRFVDHGPMIEFVDPDPDAYSTAYVAAGNSPTYWLAQANRQIRIAGNRFNNGQYAVLSHALDSALTMFANADSEFTDNYVIGNRWIKGLLVRGFDGWKQHGNYWFMPGYNRRASS